MRHHTIIACLAAVTLSTTLAKAEDKIIVNPTAIARAQQKTDSPLLTTLKTTKVSAFKVKDMQVETAFKLLSKRYKDMSPTGSSLNVLFKDTSKEQKKKLINVDLSSSDVPVTDVIYYLCMNAGLNFRVDNHAVVVWPRKAGEQLNRY